MNGTMAERQFFPNEHELCRWKSVILTTHRVLSDDAAAQTSRSILLHRVSGTEVVKRDQPILILLAVLASVGGVVTKKPELGFILAAVLTAIYFGTREVALVISGDDRKISRTISGSGADQRDALVFADRVDRVTCLVTRRPEAEPRLSSEGPFVSQEQPRDPAWARH